MNRFYCTVCKKIKRVQHYPSNVVNRESISPHARLGQCRRHESYNYQAIATKVNRKVG